jgi:Flp pilus assembly protein TadG
MIFHIEFQGLFRSLLRLSGQFRLGRQGSVAVWIGLMIPVFVAALSLGVEVSSWEAAQLSLQRTADVSAIAGALSYKSSQNAQAAATSAAEMAQLNGGAGMASPTWSNTCSGSCTSPCTGTLTDNQITAQVIMCSGNVTALDVMIKVTVWQSVAATVSRLFDSTSSYRITGMSTAEVVSTGGYTGTGNSPSTGGGQPCLLALSNSGTISGQGSTYWTMPNCTVRSNGTVDVHGGGGPLLTAGIYAGGAIDVDSWIATTGGQYANDGVVTDPYLSSSVLQAALTQAANLTSVANIACGSVGGIPGTSGQYTGNNNCNGSNTLPNGGVCATSNGVTCTLYPGNYGSFSISGGPYTFNFEPGLYLFKGNISLTNSSTSNGSGVTIVTAGSFTGQNSFNFNITAPTLAQASSSGGVAGVALASSSTTTATISGNAAFNIAGVAYFPNAIFDASGSSCNSSSPCFGNSSTACLEIIAQSIKLSGNSDFGSNCSSLGAATFTSLPGSSTSSAQLVH